MKRLLPVVFLAIACGCKTYDGPERGPQGTVAYQVEILADEPGVKIEVNGEYEGETPVSLKVFGDKDGTFHNFNNSSWLVKALPLHAGQTVHTKEFHTGGWFQSDDKIPKRIYFDMNLGPEPKTPPGFNVNINTTSTSTNTVINKTEGK